MPSRGHTSHLPKPRTITFDRKKRPARQATVQQDRVWSYITDPSLRMRISLPGGMTATGSRRSEVRLLNARAGCHRSLAQRGVDCPRLELRFEGRPVTTGLAMNLSTTAAAGTETKRQLVQIRCNGFNINVCWTRGSHTCVAGGYRSYRRRKPCTLQRQTHTRS